MYEDTKKRVHEPDVELLSAEDALEDIENMIRRQKLKMKAYCLEDNCYTVKIVLVDDKQDLLEAFMKTLYSESEEETLKYMEELDLIYYPMELEIAQKLQKVKWPDTGSDGEGDVATVFFSNICKAFQIPGTRAKKVKPLIKKYKQYVNGPARMVINY